MNKLLLAAALAGGIFMSFSPAFAAAVTPCEDMLKDVQSAAASAKLKAADRATFADLQMKGTERCKADDDAGADKFFADALKLAGK